jgi:hypothetical protein
LQFSDLWFTLPKTMGLKKKYFQNYLGCACLLVTALLLPAETLTYREVEGDSTTIHILVITPTPPGYRIDLASSREPGGTIRQTFRTAADLTTRAWTISDPSRQMDLAAAIDGEAIILRGSVRGKKVEKSFAAAGPPWNQLFQMGLGPFAMGEDGSWQFRSIGTQGPGELKIGKFTVKRQETEKIRLSGKEFSAIHLRVSLSGLLSIFWHGDYWFRLRDGRFLRYRGKNRSGGPLAVSELIGEKTHEEQ